MSYLSINATTDVCTNWCLHQIDIYKATQYFHSINYVFISMSIIGILTLVELTLYEKGWYAFGNNVIIDWMLTLGKIASILLLYAFIVANVGNIR